MRGLSGGRFHKTDCRNPAMKAALYFELAGGRLPPVGSPLDLVGNGKCKPSHKPEPIFNVERQRGVLSGRYWVKAYLIPLATKVGVRNWRYSR